MNEAYIIIATYLSSTLSFIGCFMMVIYYVCFPTDRAAAHLFCLWLGISGIGLALATFIRGQAKDVDSGDFLCTLFPLIEDYFILCSSFTTAIIAIRVKIIVFQQKGCSSLSDSQLKTYFAVVWGLPLLLVLVPLTTNSYGRNDGDWYCFFKYDRDDKEKDNVWAKAWMFLLFYGPILVSFCVIIVIYAQCVIQINILQVRHALHSLLTVDHNLLFNSPLQK